MDITLHYGNNPPFIAGDHEKKGLGGTENYTINVARQLRKLGHAVRFYNMQPLEAPIVVDAREGEGIYWGNVKDFNPDYPGDVLISFRMREVFHKELKPCHKVLILADTESVGLGDDVRAGLIDSVVAVSSWQMNKIAKEEGLEGHPCWILSSNGINIRDFDGITFKKDKLNPICLHMSTPERGLGLLLELWPQIYSKLVESNSKIRPYLYLLSSYAGWGVTAEQNEEMCKSMYEAAGDLYRRGYHVFNLKHANSKTLKYYQLHSNYMLYPTNFKETYCISLTECMFAGAIPITSNKAALSERITDGINGYTVGSPDDDAVSDKAKEEYVTRVVEVMLQNDNVLEDIRYNSRKYATMHDYATVVPKLLKEIERRL